MKIDFTQLKSAARSAIQSARGTSGVETDPDLRIYNRLKPSDFPALIQKYGQESVLGYIKEMETRKAGKNG